MTRTKHSAVAADMFLSVCIQSSVRLPASLQTYRGGSKEASMLGKKNLAILVRTHLHKHGTLIPESLHAESQWDRPKWVDQEVGRS